MKIGEEMQTTGKDGEVATVRHVESDLPFEVWTDLGRHAAFDDIDGAADYAAEFVLSKGAFTGPRPTGADSQGDAPVDAGGPDA